MKRFLAPLIALVILGAIGAASFFMGQQFFLKNNNFTADNSQSTSENTNANTLTSSQQPAREYYTVGTPSNGPLWAVLPLKFSYIDETIAIAPIPGIDPNTIKREQVVYLYDAYDKPMPFTAQVRQVIPSSETLEVPEIIIDLPSRESSVQEVPFLKDTKMQIETPGLTLQPYRAELLLSMEYNARRLPLSSLQKDAAGEPYIWIAQRHMDDPYRASLLKRAVYPRSANKDLMDMGKQVGTDEFVVLEPDDSLYEGAIITVDIGSFVVPTNTPLTEARFTNSPKIKVSMPEVIEMNGVEMKMDAVMQSCPSYFPPTTSAN